AEAFLLPGLQDAAGNALSTLYHTSFRTAADPSTQAPFLVAIQPTGNVPPNTVFMARFSEPIDPATITPATVVVQADGVDVPGTRSLDATGTLFRFVPSAPYPPAAGLLVQVTAGGRGHPGTAVATAPFPGAGVEGPADTTGPTVTSVSPADGATGVGVNAELRLRFDETLNPVTVDGSTIRLSAGAGALMPCTISFGEGDRLVRIVPH